MEEILALDAKAALRHLLDVAKVALGPTMPEVPDDEALELLIRLLAVVDRAMPPELQRQDPRVMLARIVLDAMRQ